MVSKRRIKNLTHLALPCLLLFSAFLQLCEAKQGRLFQNNPFPNPQGYQVHSAYQLSARSNLVVAGGSAAQKTQFLLRNQMQMQQQQLLNKMIQNIPPTPQSPGNSMTPEVQSANTNTNPVVQHPSQSFFSNSQATFAPPQFKFRRYQGPKMYGIQGLQRAKSIPWKKMVNQDLFEISQLSMQEYDYYEQKYSISSFQEIPFCVVVPTYNNAANDRYLRNIRSIVMQNYTNFHIVVFDDASTDKTGELISSFLENQKKVPKQNYHIQRNEQQMKAMYNLRRAAMEFCKPLQIFLIVDGDDQLLGRQVLKLYSAYFQKNEAWFVYSNFLMGENNAIGYSRPFPQSTIQSNNYRNYPFVTSHLRAFYTKLFRNIKDSDLRGEDDQYFKAANDVAICIPCLQQAHTRVKYLPELTYFYNSNTGQNNHMVRAYEQRNNDRIIRRKQHYEPLKQLFE